MTFTDQTQQLIDEAFSKRDQALAAHQQADADAQAADAAAQTAKESAAAHAQAHAEADAARDAALAAIAGELSVPEPANGRPRPGAGRRPTIPTSGALAAGNRRP